MAMITCHICNSADLELVCAPAEPVGLVSSDVRIVEGRVAWAVCQCCLTIQKCLDDGWRRLAEQTYAQYDINHQSAGGEEPRLFNTELGSGPRSEIILRYFLRRTTLPDTGTLLDIGCSNGNLLKAFHHNRPDWELYGSEISDTWRGTVLALPGVKGFHVGRNISYPLRYNLITMCHVLEHVPNPTAFVRSLMDNLAAEARLLIVVPNIRQNPIDLLIADHCSHFDQESLSRVITASGLEVEDLSAQTISKELIAIVKRPASQTIRRWHGMDYVPAAQLCRDYFRLYAGVRDAARSAAAEASHFGIMGSSIAAAWLAHELDDHIEFFVDEDESRLGHMLMGHPILSFAEVPEGATVFIPMSVTVAEKIIARATDYPIHFRYLDWNVFGTSHQSRQDNVLSAKSP